MFTLTTFKVILAHFALLTVNDGLEILQGKDADGLFQETSDRPKLDNQCYQELDNQC